MQNKCYLHSNVCVHVVYAGHFIHANTCRGLRFVPLSSSTLVFKAGFLKYLELVDSAKLVGQWTSRSGSTCFCPVRWGNKHIPLLLVLKHMLRMWTWVLMPAQQALYLLSYPSGPRYTHFHNLHLVLSLVKSFWHHFFKSMPSIVSKIQLLLQAHKLD